MRNESSRFNFQPEIRLIDGAVVGAEALLRWRHPERGIADAGRVHLAACDQRHRIGRRQVDHSDRLPESRRLARNGAVARTHRHQRVPAPIPGRCFHIDDALRETKLPPESIELEITENSTLNYGDAAETLQKLHDRRVRIAFDDFGTGYASLSYLTRFPLSRIKIDRSFVRKIIDDTDAAAIVRSLIVMAHNLGLEVIAEGVETQAQVDLA